jgi:hypothetical protein
MPTTCSTLCTKECSHTFLPFCPASVWPSCRGLLQVPPLACLSQPWHLANLAPRRRLCLTTMSGAGRRGPKFGPLLCLVVSYEQTTFSCLKSIADTLTHCLAVLHRRGALPADRRASGVHRRVTKEPSRTSGENPGWISGPGFQSLSGQVQWAASGPLTVDVMLMSSCFINPFPPQKFITIYPKTQKL